MDAATSLVGTQIGSTLLAVGGMQYLKNLEWFPLMKKGAKVLNRVVSLIVAGAIALGIHYVWSPGTDGGHTLTITIPSLYTLAVGGFHWASQFIYQETGYTVLGGLQALQGIVGKLESVIPQPPHEHPTPGEASIQVTPVKP